MSESRGLIQYSFPRKKWKLQWKNWKKKLNAIDITSENYE